MGTGRLGTASGGLCRGPSLSQRLEAGKDMCGPTWAWSKRTSGFGWSWAPEGFVEPLLSPGHCFGPTDATESKTVMDPACEGLPAWLGRVT